MENEPFVIEYNANAHFAERVIVVGRQAVAEYIKSVLPVIQEVSRQVMSEFLDEKPMQWASGNYFAVFGPKHSLCWANVKRVTRR